MKGGDFVANQVVEEDGQFWIKNDDGDYFLDTDTEAERAFETREEAEAVLASR